ncbi:alpha/beta fold hydrolase [Castellaniella sp.]|uniref:alpha/beta fold hydrolase n=1 Tax=Castellaniella sp. TaxID=1955812 RepID=UPI003C77EC2D
MTAINTIPIRDTVVQVSGQGHPLVFIHGFTTTGEFWREQVAPFSDAFQVIRINLPGHGVSPHPTGRPYTIDAFTQDVLAVFKALAIPEATVIGLSMGGTIAQQFALRYPDRTRALVLVGATPHGLGTDVSAGSVHDAITELGVVGASQRVIDRSFSPSTAADIVAFARTEVAQTPEFVAREAITSLNASDSRHLLDQIHMPTLIVVGEDDIITPPAESELLAASIPGSILEILPQAGHFPMLERPHAFNALLADFLRTVQATSATSIEKTI